MPRAVETGVDLFFNPDSERGKSKRTREANAKAVCATCPVIQQCLTWAMTVNEPYGVWGGKSADERHAIRNDGRGLAIAKKRVEPAEPSDPDVHDVPNQRS